MDVFETVYLIGFTVASVIRSYYGLQFQRKGIAHSDKENPVVFVGMALWGVALILPFIAIFSGELAVSDYEMFAAIKVLGALIIIGSLWVLWRAHVDLAANFSPSLFIRENHVLVTQGIYHNIRHPMYLSFYMWAIGQALIIDNWLAGPLGLLAMTMIYRFRVPREERQLLSQFGAEYESYQKRTGRLLPKLNG
ncbi:MAG: protein-S-isoprenylcysteine O-methyltransferase [Gammaproteobacteria bacterium]|nr:protein-S-isoprenylcysteine O-methyltransferase [Gammaproteobacteria bacterium]